MYLKEQLYILEISRQQSLSKAAANLHVSQPALSTFLHNLENTLGVPLFYREKRRLIPTQAGLLYIETASKMVRLQEKFYLQLDSLLGSPCGILKIGIQRIRAPYTTIYISQFLKEKYPDMEVVFVKGTLSDLNMRLESGELDLIMGYYIPQFYPPEIYTHLTIEEDILKIAATKEAADLISSNLNFLNGQTFILQPKEQSERLIAEEFFAKYQVVPGKIIEDDSIETTMRMTAMGIGISLTLDSYVRHLHFPDNLRYVHNEKGLKSLKFSVIMKRPDLVPVYIKDLITFERTIF